ncbi:MAG: hypothetical protein IJS47_01090 [Clostridia bacterium]|nr:hypothetical protein [Clostridia bacterium]
MGKKERKKVREWLEKNEEAYSDNQQDFLRTVRWALKAIKYEYFIATIEPVFDDDYNLVYKPGEEIVRKIKVARWPAVAKTYFDDGEWHSELATLYELMLWYAYRVAEGYWAIEYVCDDSSALGNFEDSPTSSHEIESTNSRVIGGFADGVGNTTKVVMSPAFKSIALVGGSYKSCGKNHPVAMYRFEENYNFSARHFVGVVVIKKS